MNRLEIVYLNPAELTPYENNARKHGPEDIEQIKESIQADGFNDPIGIWGEKNIIVEGHGRQIAALEMGLDRVPCIRLDHLSDKQRREYAIRHNRTAELSAWDWDALEEELAGLEIEGVDLSGLNFDFDGIPGVSDTDPAAEEDDFDVDAPVEAKAKRGDIYRLGRHRLMCGDSTNAEDVKKLLNGNHVQLLLTDPPYGINVVRGGTSEQVTGRVGGGWPASLPGQSEETRRFTSGTVGGGSMNTPRNNRITPDAVVPAKTYKAIIGDETTETAKENFEIAKEYTDDQIIFGGNYFTDFLPVSRCWIVWDKNNTGNFADAELAWTSFDKGVKLYKWTWNGLVREGDRDIEGITRVHPTQKPVGMLGNILNDFTEEGNCVLDCFGGSGSTLMACEQLNRTCYMMELDPHYVDVIIARWESLTGEKAEKIS